MDITDTNTTRVCELCERPMAAERRVWPKGATPTTHCYNCALPLDELVQR